MIAIIVARSSNGVIGLNGDLPWGRSLKGDLRRFKRRTTGHTVIMGRKTHESIGRSLPNRHNIVLTRRAFYVPADAKSVTAPSLKAALRSIDPQQHAYIIGGTSVYGAALLLANCIVETEVLAELQGDAFFPAIDPQRWEPIFEERHEADSVNAYPYVFRTYLRRSDHGRPTDG